MAAKNLLNQVRNICAPNVDNNMPWTKKIGALWFRENKNGPYYVGKVIINGQEVKIVAMFNKNKRNDTHPALEIYPKAERPEPGHNSIL